MGGILEKLCSFSNIPPIFLVITLRASYTIQAKTGRHGIAPAEGAVEANAGGGACGERTIPGQAGRRHLLAGLRPASTPALAHLLRGSGEGKGKRPAVERGRAGIRDSHIGREAAGPFVLHHVDDLTRASRHGC